MSRVFSAMTGTGPTRSAVLSENHGEDEQFVVETEDTPFVEIGGPSGPVFSPVPKFAPAEPKAKGEAPRAFPRIAAPAPVVPAPAPVVLPFGTEAPIPVPAPVPAPAPVSAPAPATYLSVQFHDVLPLAPDRPAGGPDAGLVALHFPDHPVSGEYRALRDDIARQLPNATSRALMLTAATPEAGTTTVLLNLGITLARDGQRVLVLDANVTRAGVAPKLALRSAPGLAEVLGGNLPLPWALQPTAVPNLQALAAGVATDVPGLGTLAGALGHELPKLVAQLRQWFDWVLIDAGVWGVVPERDSTCASADAVYLVTRESDAERPEFTGLRTWVKQLGGPLRGYVTTRA